MNCERRDVLRAACALPLAGLAGCTGFFGGSQPGYATDIPRDGAEEGSGVFFIHLDAAWLRGYESTDLAYREEISSAVDFDFDPDRPLVDVDPLVALPTAGVLLGAIYVAFGVSPYGFGGTLLDALDRDVLEEVPAEDDAIDGDVEIDSVLLVDGVAVFRGSFDARTIVAAADDFELVAERDGFDVYEGTGFGFLGPEELAFAVDDDVLFVRLDDESSLDPVMDATLGETTRLGDEEGADWMLESGGHGHVTTGVWMADPEDETDDTDPEDEFLSVGDVLDDAIGFASSFTLESEVGRANFAAVYPDDHTPDRSAVEAEFGDSATDREISVSEGRLAVTGEWRADSGDGD